MTEKKLYKGDNLFTGVLIYGVGVFGTKILVFLIVPIYTYYISTEEMGIYDLIVTTINLLTPLLTLQISDAAYRWMMQNKDDKKIYIKTTLQFISVSCVLISIFMILISKIFYFQYIYFIVVVLITSNIRETLQTLLRGLSNRKLYSLTAIIYTVIFLIMNIIQICLLDMGITAFFWSTIVANVVTIVLIVCWEKEFYVNLISVPDVKLFKIMLKFSIPLVANQINWWVMNSLDRYIVNIFLGVSANGILSIAHKFPSMLQIVLGLFITSWQDISIADDHQSNKVYNTNLFEKFYQVAFSMLWILIPVTNIFIILVMNDEYKCASEYVPFYYLGAVFYSFAAFYGVGYLQKGDTKKTFFTSVVGAITNTVINLLLIKYIGLQASAISTFLGYFVMWIMRERHNRSVLGINIDRKKFFLFLVITIIVSIASKYMSLKYNIIFSLWGMLLFIIINYSFIRFIVKKCLKKCI